jgi:hypothetical protein
MLSGDRVGGITGHIVGASARLEGSRILGSHRRGKVPGVAGSRVSGKPPRHDDALGEGAADLEEEIKFIREFERLVQGGCVRGVGGGR